MHKDFPFRPTYWDSFYAAKLRALDYADEIGSRFRFITHEASAVRVHEKERV